MTFESGEVVTARSVIIATGARYNRLPLDRLTEFEGVGVYYAATQMEAMACGAAGRHRRRGELGRPGRSVPGSTCNRVYIAIRGPSLDSSMSRYLIDQIDRMPHIKVLPHTQVTG